MAKSTSNSKKITSPKTTSMVLPKAEPMAIPGSSVPATTMSSDPNGLEDLLLDSIKDIFWAENHLVKALPKMIKAAASAKLKNAFTDHLSVTKGQVMRLEKVFELLQKKKQAKKCDAMEGIVMEGEGVIDDTDEGTLSRDIGLIHAARKVENYEMTNYKGIIELATALGKNDIIPLLSENLAEEQESDDLLASISTESLGNLNPAHAESV